MELDRTIAPEIQQISHFSIMQPERLILTNGMPLNILRAGSEEVVRFDLLVKGGQLHQTQPLQAVLTNRMLREGTRSFTSTEIAERLDYYGAWLDLSSSVSHGYISLYSLNKYFPQTLRILASMVQEAVFPEKELNTVLEANKHQFLVNNERVDVLARKQLNRSLFGPGHPLGRYAVFEDYDKITSEVLRQFHETHYHSGNCSAYISGNVTPEIIRAIEENFGNGHWGKGTVISQAPCYSPEPESQKRVFIEKGNAMQSSIKIGGFTLGKRHPDALKYKVLVTLFGGYFGSRLMSNIREEKGYTYGIGAGIVSYPGNGILIISTEAGNEYIEPVITEVYHEMDRLCEEKVSQQELTMVKNYILGDMCRSYESAFSLADAWIYIENEGLDNDFYTRSVDAVKAVTPDELLELAQKYFCKENLIEVVAGKKV